ncbi:hypothetical protein [Massilia sp. BJB1822]|uniref:hypothetical protein n=1 Tax=Massilia sp. BJB1822 TaxID=2744470 RepID=UPI0015931FB7|nr:hypothetical protein [Massilia sp. BJB1822]NVE01139.1 hypothetical protein [Massilia sp. BJB1822]
MDNNYLLILLVVVLFGPPLIAWLLGVYFMFLFMRSRRGAGPGAEFLAAILGPAVLGVPRLMSEDSRKYLKRFYICAAFFVGYLAFLASAFYLLKFMTD